MTSKGKSKRTRELPARLDPSRLEAGCDEAGRGCIAGPVVAAAVILPPDLIIPDLYDSKQLSATKREQLRTQIIEQALAYSIAAVSPEVIDEINILQASFRAMHLAIEGLALKPDHLLIDGNRFRTTTDTPYTCIVKGDSKIASIAAASILAKTYRDDYMTQLDKSYPHYGWAQNAGYPTAAHLEALHAHGISPHHRRTFGPCRPTLFDGIDAEGEV